MIGAVDIGGTKIAVGAVSGDGRILAERVCPTAPELGAANAVTRIVEMLKETAAEAGSGLDGIGIGCTGPVDPFRGTIGDVPFLPGWMGLELAGELAHALGVTVAMENDADAAALGEAMWGAGRGIARFVLVTVGTGIGVGTVLGGELYRGAGGAHPEAGHHVIEAGGPPCACGAQGCWESLASGPAMADWLHGRQSHAGPLDAGEICAAAMRAEPAAQQAVAREGRYLGVGLANLVNIFVPDVIALGGGLMQNRDLFMDGIEREIRARCRLVPYERVRLVPPLLGRHAGLAGAACVWYHRYRPATRQRGT